MKRAHIGAMKRAHTVVMKRSKLVYTGDTQPKRESVMTPHYASLTYQVKIGEGKVKMHIGCSGAMDLDHSHRYFIRPKTSEVGFCNGVGALSSRT